MFNKERFQKAVLYLVSKSPEGRLRGKKKLAKLLYFADFDFFEIYEKPITGATYRAIKMGPCPDELNGSLEELSKGALVIKKEDLGLENDMVVVELSQEEKNKHLDFSIFSEKEKEVLDSVLRRYGGSSGTDLEKITHSEAPYNSVGQGEILPYELSFYRGKEQEIIGM